jgi:hypothetical protein
MTRLRTLKDTGVLWSRCPSDSSPRDQRASPWRFRHSGSLVCDSRDFVQERPSFSEHTRGRDLRYYSLKPLQRQWLPSEARLRPSSSSKKARSFHCSQPHLSLTSYRHRCVPRQRPSPLEHQRMSGSSKHREIDPWTLWRRSTARGRQWQTDNHK